MKRNLLLRPLAVLLCMTMALAAFAQVVGGKRFSESFTNAPMSEVLKTIGKKSGVRVQFAYEDVGGYNVSVKLTNVTAEEAVKKVIDNRPLTYKFVDGKFIVVSKRKQNPLADNNDYYEIKGRVVDANDDPLPGVSIGIDGGRMAATTDKDGHFTIRVANSETKTLQFSFVGMETQTVKLAGKRGLVMNIVMHEKGTYIDEVVVTGYQNIKREKATGSYTILSGDDINKRRNVDIASSLEGNIPGLVKNRNSYQTGENNLVIRGVGTFSASTAPLVVVDGLPIEGGIETVNIYDIKSVTVLKDASAAAIYGARASNGVIVITTKQADREKLTVEFNADLSITGKTDYSKGGWATAAQAIELERLNWNGMKENDPDQFSALINRYNDYDQRSSFSPVTRLFARNYLGEISDDQLNGILDSWSRNDYRKEWQDASERTRVVSNYNLSLRNQGKNLASTFTLNYTDDNLGMKKENSRALQFRYKGDLKATKWLDLSFSVNVINNSQKTNAIGEYGKINAFYPYQSMFNADGSRARMEADAMLDNPVFDNPSFGLLDHSFNLLDEVGLNTSKQSGTNIRAYIHALFHLPVKGWTASAMYQHEDIRSQSETEYYKSSYYARNIYNRYTTGGITKQWVIDPNVDFYDFLTNPDNYPGYSFYNPATNDYFYDENGNFAVAKQVESNLPTEHHIPEGGMLSTYNSRSTFYTFRAQTDFNRTFGKHSISALAGFEYRQTKTNGTSATYLGYDHQTMANQNTHVDWDFVNGFGNMGILGTSCPPLGAYANFNVSETLHRFYSYYFTGNYCYDSRYSIFGSYRVDKTDLFGTDPKFRGRPLWSVGGSWNIHNEAFLRSLTFIHFLKLRISYGLTGNINQNAKSVMTASLTTNRFNGGIMGEVQEAPNDQLRWEKTSIWNLGLDFSLFGSRLNGSIDAYRKYSTDILTEVAMDITSGYDDLLLNAGEMLNTGVELQLKGCILPAYSRKDVGVNLGITFGRNHNEVKKVFYQPRTGSEFRSMRLKEGYPLNTVTGIDYAGYVTDDKGITYGTWRDHNGEIHMTSLSSSEFTIDDCIYLGTSTPVWTGGIIPEIRYQGFTLSSMIHYYGGHYMDTDSRVWNLTIYDGEIAASKLDFWNGVEGAVPNGYLTKYYDSRTMNLGAEDYRNYERADYLKVRSVTLAYEFERKLIRRLGLSDLCLRLQVDNVATWARNGRGWDPEATRIGGIPVKTPSTYTFSVLLKL